MNSNMLELFFLCFVCLYIKAPQHTSTTLNMIIFVAVLLGWGIREEEKKMFLIMILIVHKTDMKHFPDNLIMLFSPYVYF